MAIFAAGGSGVGEIINQHATGQFHFFILYFHLLMTGDAQFMISGFVIPGSQILIALESVGLFGGLGNIMAAGGAATPDGSFFIPFMVTGLTAKIKVGRMRKLNPRSWLLY